MTKRKPSVKLDPNDPNVVTTFNAIARMLIHLHERRKTQAVTAAQTPQQAA